MPAIDPLLERMFSLASLLAVSGWLALALAPLWRRGAQLVAGWAIPVLIAIAYAGLVVRYWGESSGGFGSLAEVSALFGHHGLLLAGWLHYLAFDLFIGAWEVREAERVGLPHWTTLPALALTFLFGPIGLLLFLGLRAARLRTRRSRSQGEST
ncbi:MAG TPA: ABA4-like family protein [Microvirga sp.]|jgi:hypothetical protein